MQTQPMPLAQAQIFVLQLPGRDYLKHVAWTPGWSKWVPLKEVLKKYPNYFPTPPPTSLNDTDSTAVIDVMPVRSNKKLRPKTETASITEPNTKLTKTNTITNHTNPSFTKSAFEHTYTEIALNEQPPNFNDQEFQPGDFDWEKTPVVPILKQKLKPVSGDERREYRRFPHRIEVVLMTNKGRSFRSSSKNISLGGVMLREPIPTELMKDLMDIVIVNPFPDAQTPSHLLVKCRIVADSKDRRRLVFYDVSDEVSQKLRTILENYRKNYNQYKKKKSA